jgi:phenylalanyl-tRNA synthetase beta chain
VRELPTTPAVERDLSLIVGEGVLWSQIEGVLSATRPALIESWRFLGTYRGKPLNAGHKSVTLRMTFRDPTRTLRDEEVTPQVQAVVGAMQSQLGATLRV